MLILFVILTILMLILTIYTLEDNPYLSLVFITLGMIFSILCSYGMWEVDFFFVGYNASNGTTTSEIYHNYSYGDPYSYIFMFMFFIFMILFMKAGFNSWKKALEQPGELDYKSRYR